MSISRTQLSEPVTEENVLDVGEYIEAHAQDVRSLFERVQYQGGPQDLVQELWAIHCLIVQAAERLAALRTARCFPPE
jgi:hypothetical protein